MIVQRAITSAETDAERRERYQWAGQLIKQWSTEDPPYDENIGRLLGQAESELKMSCRELRIDLGNDKDEGT